MLRIAGSQMAWEGVQRSINPLAMEFDPVKRILYLANWNAGIWALKLSYYSGGM
ncbi:MAG: hypothetical protein M3Y08_20455 [Fibrobacterota bacterium]|nr:hypothetical protein [Fibrobacterota bacterium]